MKTAFKRIFLIATLATFSFTSSYSQFDQITEMLKAGADDAEILANAYLSPLGKGLGYSLADGWYNTASNHKTLGFSLNLSMNVATLPDAAKTFDISTLGLEFIESADPSDPIFPTVLNGDDPNTIIARVEGEEVLNTELKGVSFPAVPLPTITGSIGIIKNTDISFRFIPTVAMGDFGEIGLWGVGVKHDVLQWIPIVDKVPILRTSYFLGYSRLNYSKEISEDGSKTLDASLGALHTALLVGLDLPFVNPYVSLGLTSTNMNMDVLGNFDVAGQPAITDPFSLSFKNSLAPSVGAGLRIKLAVVTFHAQYTVQEYNTFSGGIGISFR